MKTYLIPLLVLTAAVLHAQEMPPQAQRALCDYHGLLLAQHVRILQLQLGSAFVTDDFLKQLEKALQQPAPEHPNTQAERLAAEMFTSLEKRDMDPAALLAALRGHLNQLPILEDEVLRGMVERKHLLAAQLVLPVLHAREAAKEQRVLELNLRREGVVALPNGVQMEVRPGQGSIRNVNRIMTEEGLLDTECITTECSVDDLPPSIARMMPHIPAGSAWIFWIPAEVTDAIAHEGEDSPTESKSREELLAELTDGIRYQSYEAVKKEIEKKNNAGNEIPAPRTRLLKLTVWQEAEDAPIKPFNRHL